ncbi:MAG: SLC13 family permease [Rhodospirillales bacterium]
MFAVLRKPANFIAFFSVVAAILVLLAPVPAGLDPKLVRAGAVLFAAVAIYATHALPEHFTSLTFMLVIVLLGIAPANVAFSGFMTSSVWLLFGGLFISLAIQHTGLTERIGKIGTRLSSLSYLKVLIAVTYASLALGFFMPATISRVIILVPIAFAIADALGFEDGRPGRAGIALAASIGTFLPGYGILPANLPNVVMSGASEAIYKLPFTFGEFLIWHFPVTGVLKAALLIWVIATLFPDTVETPKKSTVDLMPNTNRQRLLQLILAATMCLWATDFLHGISPGHISLLAALVIMIPGLKLIPEDAFQKKINLTPFFYVAGILSVGAVVQHTGLGSIAAKVLIDVISPQPGQNFLNFLTLVGMATLINVFATSPGAPVVLAPLAQDLATAMGLPVFAVINAMAHGVSNTLFPYIGPPFVVAISLTKVPVRQGLKLCLIMAGLSIFPLVPLTYLWWRLLGFF